MATKPTVSILDWVPSGDPAKISEPSGSKKTQGWSPNEPLPAQQENWILYSLSQWQKYFEEATDSLIGITPVAILGSSQDVTDGLATHDTPQDAYDAAVAVGGGAVLIRKGTFSGNLNMNSTTGVQFKGLSRNSILSGNITIGGKFNELLDCYLTGQLSIGGYRNKCICFHINNTLSVSNFANDNFYSVNRLNAQQQQIVFVGSVSSGTYKLTYNGNESAALSHTDSASAVQVALRALTGLSSVTVTGSLAGSFIVTMTGLDNPQKLSVTSNTLVTATGSVYQYSEAGKIFLSHSGDNGIVLVETPTFAVQPYHHNCTLLVNCSLSEVELQLPQPVSGFTVAIKDFKGNAESKNIKLKRYAAEKIEQAALDARIQSNFQKRKIISDGTDYFFA